MFETVQEAMREAARNKWRVRLDFRNAHITGVAKPGESSGVWWIREGFWGGSVGCYNYQIERVTRISERYSVRAVSELLWERATTTTTTEA